MLIDSQSQNSIYATLWTCIKTTIICLEDRGRVMFLTIVVVVAWFAGLLVMFSGFERSQELKGGTLTVDHAKRTKLTYGLGVYLVISLGLLGMFVVSP